MIVICFGLPPPPSFGKDHDLQLNIKGDSQEVRAILLKLENSFTNTSL